MRRRGLPTVVRIAVYVSETHMGLCWIFRGCMIMKQVVRIAQRRKSFFGSKRCNSYWLTGRINGVYRILPRAGGGRARLRPRRVGANCLTQRARSSQSFFEYD